MVDLGIAVPSVITKDNDSLRVSLADDGVVTAGLDNGVTVVVNDGISVSLRVNQRATMTSRVDDSAAMTPGVNDGAAVTTSVNDSAFHIVQIPR